MELVAGRAVGDGDLDRGPARRSSAFVIVGYDDVVALLDQHAAGPQLPIDLVVHVVRRRHRRVLIRVVLHRTGWKMAQGLSIN